MLLSRLQILAAAVLWSTAGAAIKLCELQAWQISLGRSLVAALTLFALMPEARRIPSARALKVSLAYAATVTLFVLATKYTTAANAIFIQDTAPLYVLLLSPWLLKEIPTRSELLAVPVFLAGLGLFFLDQLQPGHLRGNLLALASGVAFALSIMGLRAVNAEGASVLAWGNLLSALVSVPGAIGGPSPGVRDLAILLFLGVFQLALAYVLFTRGVKTTPAVEASLLILIEPVLNPLWAFLLAGEEPGRWAMAGGALILAGTVWRTIAGARSADGRSVSVDSV